MGEAFGARLRRLRTARGRTIGALASELGIQKSYLTDIETGRRYPPHHDKILEAAAVLGLDHRETLELGVAAAHDRGFVRLPVASPSHAEIASELEIRWTALGEDGLESIRRALQGG